MQSSLKSIIIYFAFFAAFHVQSQAQTSIFEWSEKDSLLADSILSATYKQEGLYTIYGDLKPISTVLHYSIAFDSITGKVTEDEKTLEDVQRLNNIARELSNDSITFVSIPFKEVQEHKRVAELVVVNHKRLRQLLETEQDFFFQWGFTEHTPVEVILTTIEFEARSKRYYAYGHLFGYPSYAVDFFVEAADHQKETGEFVSRKFFQIPVYSGQEGRFVYAYPEDAEPGEEDLNLRNSAEAILAQFKLEFDVFDFEAYPEHQRFTYLLYHLHHKQHGPAAQQEID